MHRRTLLTAIAAAAAPAVTGWRKAPIPPAIVPERIGLQLYTVRNEMARDLPATLRAVAETGYREVEFAGTFSRSPRELRELLASFGLTAPAAHAGYADIGGDWQRTIRDASATGCQWLVVPWLPERVRGTADEWKRVAGQFNRAAAVARAAAGVRFAYHNHDFEFRRVEGQVPFDILLAETDPELVDFELDLYWITRAGFDPAAYLTRHRGRFPLVHVKDSAGPPEHRMVDVGSGTIDWRMLLVRAQESGTRHFFVEHDSPADPLASIRASYAHLASLPR